MSHYGKRGGKNENRTAGGTINLKRGGRRKRKGGGKEDTVCFRYLGPYSRKRRRGKRNKTRLRKRREIAASKEIHWGKEKGREKKGEKGRRNYLIPQPWPSDEGKRKGEKCTPLHHATCLSQTNFSSGEKKGRGRKPDFNAFGCRRGREGEEKNPENGFRAG